MSLGAFNLHILSQRLATLRDEGHPSKEIVSLGYPDILARPEAIDRVFGAGFFAKLEQRPDSASILAWHGIKQPYPMAEAASLFAALGFELRVIDLHAVRGGEIVLDLNEPIPESLHRRFSLVIDAGTLEHCFNIAQAVSNVANLVDVGGFVMHGNPLNMFNHGFYNLNPTWYDHFYGANGFAIDMAVVVATSKDPPEIFEAPLNSRFHLTDRNLVQVVVARRREAQPIIWPVQKKYVGSTQTG
jgi:hypothetical protein